MGETDPPVDTVDDVGLECGVEVIDGDLVVSDIAANCDVEQRRVGHVRQGGKASVECGAQGSGERAWLVGRECASEFPREERVAAARLDDGVDPGTAHMLGDRPNQSVYCLCVQWADA